MSAEDISPIDLIEDYSDTILNEVAEAAKPFLPLLGEISQIVPSVKTAVAVIKFPRNMSDVLLARKINTFLYASGISDESLAVTKQKLNPKDQVRIWERVIFSINAHDDKRKSEILGKLFRALTSRTITQDDFFDLVHATNNLNLNTLDKLKSLYMLSGNNSLSSNLNYSFGTLGLLYIDNSGIGTLGGGGPAYQLNQLGWKYIGIIYNNPISSVSSTLVGQGDLVIEFGKDWQKTGLALPLAVINEKGFNHEEVDIFIMNKIGQILCNLFDDLPVVVLTSVILAGETANTTAEKLTYRYTGQPRGILGRRMEETPVNKWAFVVEDEEDSLHAVFKDTSTAQETLINLQPKSDYSRYLSGILTEASRIASGEL